MRKTLILLGLLLVFSVLNGLRLEFPKAYCAGENWLSGFNYRKQHNITGSSFGNVTDYPIEIKCSYGSGSDSPTVR